MSYTKRWNPCCSYVSDCQEASGTCQSYLGDYKILKMASLLSLTDKFGSTFQVINTHTSSLLTYIYYSSSFDAVVFNIQLWSLIMNLPYSTTLAGWKHLILFYFIPYSLSPKSCSWFTESFDLIELWFFKHPWDEYWLLVPVLLVFLLCNYWFSRLSYLLCKYV